MRDVAAAAAADPDFLQHALPPLQNGDVLLRVHRRPADSGEETGGAAADDEGRRCFTFAQKSLLV